MSNSKKKSGTGSSKVIIPEENKIAAPAEAERKFQEICAELRNFFMEEYSRGGRDAVSRILHLVPSTFEGARLQEGFGVAEPIKRAPRGSAKAFVEKALANGPKSVREIQESAGTSLEKFLSYQTIRLELLRGEKSKRYKKVKSGWALA